MIAPSRLICLSAAAVAALALTACASTRVWSYLEPGTDFSRYRTYDWASAEQFSTGDPRLDNNPFFQERLQADVDKELAARGFEKSPSEAPDLLLHYHASIRERIDVSGLDREYEYEDEDSRPFVYEAGTLGLDFVDARTNRLIWRGWAEASMDGVIDDQAWMEQKIDEVVTRILERLPRRL
jgi:hypothetical protein